MEADKHEEQIWQLYFGIMFIFLICLTANVIIHEHEIRNNNAKTAIITPINKNSYNAKDEINKKDY